MYELIIWMCLTSGPQCDMHHSMKQMVLMFPAKSMPDCEEGWKASLEEPDPAGTKSYHVCRAVQEPI
jgi:hypothetical protein